MSGSASVAGAYEVAEGKTRMSDGVASSGTTGSRRRHCLADAPEIGGIVTAPEYAKQKERNDTWCVLAELSVPSEPGNERLAMERIAEVVPDLAARLEGLQTSRGWGLFLTRNMVDEMHIAIDEVRHTVGLVMHLKGDEDAG